MHQTDTKEHMAAQIKVNGTGSGVVVTGARVDLHLSPDEADSFAEGLRQEAAECRKVLLDERRKPKEDPKPDPAAGDQDNTAKG